MTVSNEAVLVAALETGLTTSKARARKSDGDFFMRYGWFLVFI
ncbi:hypothetical protein C943_01763 [Mariniradius saccharolyticus AK6]|uniref:Uncharacterized protein n=1 Tax=Mariniradius saccharolyticus AK6 TaxID=1239962 RepID=M7XA81_9BACT|nr:hypothetical protein C943_01763 [Mariniradius saccharolyticus AK6]